MAGRRFDVLNGPFPELAIKTPVRVIASGEIDLYGLQQVDGVQLVERDRVLVTGQSDGRLNGIYDASISTWTRSVDANGARDLAAGCSVEAQEGDVWSGHRFKLVEPLRPVIGTDYLVFRDVFATIAEAQEGTRTDLFVSPATAVHAVVPNLEEALEDIDEGVAAAAASAALAAAQAVLAQNSAAAAAEAEENAEDAATTAENAAAAALLNVGNIYDSVAEAEADVGVTTGDLYYVQPSQYADGFIDLYERTGGGSTLRGTVPNRAALEPLRNELAFTYDAFYPDLIWFDRVGIYPLGRGIYVPTTFQRNRKGATAITKTDIGPNAASGFTTHTFLALPSLSAVYEVWLDLSTGAANARLKASTSAASLPTIDDGGYVHICTIRGNRVMQAAFDIRSVTAPSGAKFRSNTVIDGQKLYVGYMAASNGDYAYVDGGNVGLFREIYNVVSGAATLWVCRDLAASGAIVEIAQAERPQPPRYVVLAYRQQGFWSSDFPFLGPEFPFGSISNLSPAGRNLIDSADWYARGLSEVVDIEDPHALALGFTKGLRANVIPVEFTSNIPRRLVEYGGRVIDSAPGKWVFAACTIITDTANNFGNPSVILSHRDTLIPRSSPLGDFIVPVTPGPLYLVEQYSDYCASFAGWIQVRADSDVTAIYVGSSVNHGVEVADTAAGEAATADVIVCGVRFGIAQDQSWVSEDDFGLPGGSLSVALPSMIGDKTGIAPIIYPSRVAVFGDGDLHFYPPAMFPKRTEGADPLMTVVSEAQQQPLVGELLDPDGEPYSVGRGELTALSATGDRQITLPVNRLGSYLKINTRFRSSGRSGLRERIDNVQVIRTDPAALRNKSLVAFFLGDSLMASHGIAHSALRQIMAGARDFTVQTVGPGTFDERVGFAPEPLKGFPIYGLAQGGRRWTEFTGEWVNFRDVPSFSYVEDTPEAWAEYMAKTDAQKAVINPLLRKVVPPTWTSATNPDTLPTGNVGQVAIAPDGVHIAAAHGTTPFLWFGKMVAGVPTKLPNPAGLPAGTGTGVVWNRDGSKLFVGHGTTPFMTIYNRSGDTLTKVAGTPTMPGTARGAAWTADGKNLIVVHDNAPYVTVFNVVGDTYTPITGPTDLPTGNGRRCVLSPDGLTLAVAHTNSPGMILYKLSGSGATLTLTKLTAIDTLPTASCFVINFHPLGHSLAVGTSAAPWVMVYSVAVAGGSEGAEGDKTFTLMTGTDGPQAADIPASNPLGLVWSPDGTMVSLANGVTAATLFETAGTKWTKVTGQPTTVAAGNSAFFPDNKTILYGRSTTPFLFAVSMVDGTDSARVRSIAWDMKGNKAPFTGVLPDFPFYFARSGQPIPKAVIVCTLTNEMNDLENNTWPPADWFESDRKDRLREAFDHCIEAFYDPTLPTSLRAALGPDAYIGHVLPPIARDNFMEQRFPFQQEMYAKIIAYFENLDDGGRTRALAGHANANPEGASWLIDNEQPVDPAYRPDGLPSRYAYAADFVHLYEDMRSEVGWLIAAFLAEAGADGDAPSLPTTIPPRLFSGTVFPPAVLGDVDHNLAVVLATDEGEVRSYTYRTDTTPAVAIRAGKTPITGLFSHGQSLSIGGGAHNIPDPNDKISIKTPPAPHVVLMLNTGSRGAQGEVVDPAALTDFAPSYETLVLTAGETSGTSKGRMLAHLLEGHGFPARPFVPRASGKGASNIAQLNQGTQPYANSMIETQAMGEIAAEIYRRPFVVLDTDWEQGESDRTLPRSRADYKTLFMELADDNDVDRRAILASLAATYPDIYAGVALPSKIWMTAGQLAAGVTMASASVISLAQLDALEESDKIGISCPKYFYQGAYGYTDFLHLKAIAYDVQGEYQALAHFRRFYLGHTETCLRPDRANIERSANVIRVPMLGQIGRLVRDVTTLPPAANYGFEWTPGSGSGEITDAVPDGDAILITLSDAVGGTLRYAYTRQTTNLDTARSGAWGNFRDSAATRSIAVPGLTLPNWSVIFDATVA